MIQNKSYKSHLFNSLFPDFIKHFFYNLFIFGILYLIYFLINLFYDLPYKFETISILIFLTIFISFIKILKDLIVLLNTKYFLYETHIEKKFKFFKIENHSINYSQITDIQIKINIWDRICKTGDIILHTGNDDYGNSKKSNDLIIKDIKNPQKIKQKIMEKLHKKN